MAAGWTNTDRHTHRHRHTDTDTHMYAHTAVSNLTPARDANSDAGTRDHGFASRRSRAASRRPLPTSPHASGVYCGYRGCVYVKAVGW